MNLFLLALLIVGIGSLVRHFGGFALRAYRRGRASSAARVEAERIGKLLEAAEGGPDRPFRVLSASVVEVKAANLPCLRCGERVRADDHRAEVLDGRRLRVVTTVCLRCAFRRDVYFEIAERAGAH